MNQVIGTYKTSFQPGLRLCVFLGNPYLLTDSYNRDCVLDYFSLYGPSHFPAGAKTSAGRTRSYNWKRSITYVRR